MEKMVQIDPPQRDEVQPIKVKSNKLAFIIIAVTVGLLVLIAGGLAGYWYGYHLPQKAKVAKENESRINEEKKNRKIGQEFKLDNGKTVRIKLVTITDTKYGRQIYIDIDYSDGSLDNLKTKIVSNDSQQDRNRTVGGGSMEFSGLATGVPIESYYLLFEDGNRVYIGNATYKTDYGPSSGQEYNMFEKEENIQEPNYSPPQQNVHCNSTDWGWSTSTDCYSY